MSVYPQLRHFARAYFHQDWDLEAPTALGVVQNFKANVHPDVTAALTSEIRSILDSGMTDDEIGDLWLKTCRAEYLPSADGMTYRSWLAAVMDVLSETDASR